MKKIVLSIAILLSISIGAYFQEGHAKVENTMQTKHHHISEKQAREIALKRVKGKVIHVELEKDNGNTYYEVKMKASNNIYKLEIDTKTGKIVEIEKVNE